MKASIDTGNRKYKYMPTLYTCICRHYTLPSPSYCYSMMCNCATQSSFHHPSRTQANAILLLCMSNCPAALLTHALPADTCKSSQQPLHLSPEDERSEYSADVFFKRLDTVI